MKIDDATLLAYVDGGLSWRECVSVEKAMGESAKIARRVSRLRSSQLPYSDAFRQSLPALPESLSRSVDEAIRQYREVDFSRLAGQRSVGALPGARRRRPATRVPVLARLPLLVAFRKLSWPTFAVAFGAGVLCGGLTLQFMGSGGMGIVASGDADMAPWIRTAAGYQQLYSRETIALVQPDTSVTAATIARIREVDGLALQIPDLRRDGLTFERVQRLRFHDKPLEQIVYLPPNGPPVALCVLKEARDDVLPSSGRVDGMTVVSWRRGRLGYALIGEPGGVDLDELGRRIYDSQNGQSVPERNGKSG